MYVDENTVNLLFALPFRNLFLANKMVFTKFAALILVAFGFTLILPRGSFFILFFLLVYMRAYTPFSPWFFLSPSLTLMQWFHLNEHKIFYGKSLNNFSLHFFFFVRPGELISTWYLYHCLCLRTWACTRTRTRT